MPVSSQSRFTCRAAASLRTERLDCRWPFS
ncbi:Uncharacterised protein [Bordetella pertussis]|nr:Uncharacterised protein [Bordetella pertussis]